MNMRAKVRVTAVVRHGGTPEGGEVTSEDITFSAVTAGKFGDNNVDEDNTYSRFTPFAEFRMSITNPALINKYTVGTVYYVDFHPVHEPKQAQE